MQGTDGRDSNLSGSTANGRGDGAGPLVIRADFNLRLGHRDAAAHDDARSSAPIPFQSEADAPDAVETQAGGDAPEADAAEAAAQREAAGKEIERLRLEHRDLDTAITALGGALADQLQVQRLKRRKLALRDRIRQLEDQITPDIIA